MNPALIDLCQYVVNQGCSFFGRTLSKSPWLEAWDRELSSAQAAIIIFSADYREKLQSSFAAGLVVGKAQPLYKEALSVLRRVHEDPSFRVYAIDPCKKSTWLPDVGGHDASVNLDVLSHFLRSMPLVAQAACLRPVRPPSQHSATRVVYFTELDDFPYHHGGIVKSTVAILEALASLGHPVLALCRASVSCSDSRRAMREAWCTKHDQLESGPGWSCHDGGVPGLRVVVYDEVDALLVRLTLERADVLLTDYLHELVEVRRGYALQDLLAATPCICVCHTPTWITDSPFSHDISAARSSVRKHIHEMCSLFVCASQNLAEHALSRTLVRSSQNQQLHAYNNGAASYVAVKGRLPLPLHPTGVSTAAGSSDSSETFVVGLINPSRRKGRSIFCSLAQRMAREAPGVRFLAVRFWDVDDSDLAALRMHPNIDVIEPDENVSRIYWRCSVLLVPSLWPEPYGLVVPEALAHGTPVLVADVGGLPEALLDFTETMGESDRALLQGLILPVRPFKASADWSAATPEAPQPSDVIAAWQGAINRLACDAGYYERVCNACRIASAFKAEAGDSLGVWWSAIACAAAETHRCS